MIRGGYGGYYSTCTESFTLVYGVYMYVGNI